MGFPYGDFTKFTVKLFGFGVVTRRFVIFIIIDSENSEAKVKI